MTMAPEFVDGNDMAGTVRELFATDLTVARGQCVTCGRVGMLAEAHVYNRAPGSSPGAPVARRCSCDSSAHRAARGSTCAASPPWSSPCPRPE
jgi:hypothetical protein